MQDTETRFFSTNQYEVSVNSDNSLVFELILHEIGEFYAYSRNPLSYAVNVGNINFYNDPTVCKEAFGQYEQFATTPLLLRQGSYADDHRDGFVGESRGIRIVLSSRTGSLHVIHDTDHSVDVFNPDLKNGAKDVRRLIRNEMCMRIMESNGAAIVHGAAVAQNQQGLLVMAHRGGGKTSFFMEAMAQGAAYLSSERIVVAPASNSLMLFASPETILVFPGTLAAFSQTSEMVAHIPEVSFWERSHKIRLDWRVLGAKFMANPATNDVFLNQILYPVFEQGLEGVIVPVPEEERRIAFCEHLLTGNDTRRPNWLGWYSSHGNSVLDQIHNVPAFRVFWSDYTQITKVVREFLSRMSAAL